MANFSFDPRAHEKAPMRGESVPVGDYLVRLESSEIVENSNKNGLVGKFYFEVLEGEHVGKKIFKSFNFKNPNAKAEEISLSEYAALCEKSGKGSEVVADTAMLHGIPLGIRVGSTKDPKYPTEVKGFMTVEELRAAQALKASQPQAAPTTPAPAAPPKAEGVSWGQ